MHRENISLTGSNVAQADINNAIELTRRKFQNNSDYVILVQPLKFIVSHDKVVKTYSKAPIFKEGDMLTVISSVTTISSETHDYIVQMTKAQKLEISQILLSPQSISQNHLSSNALASGAALIHVGESQTCVAINKNGATIANLSIHDYGFKSLIQGIVKVIGCTNDEARNLVAAHATLGDEDTRNIFTLSHNAKKSFFTTNDLKHIIEAFMSRLLNHVSQFLESKQVSDLPIVVSGKIWKIEKIDRYIKEKLLVKHVSIYNPLTFIEMNDRNINALGLLNFMQTMDNVLGKQYDTKVETNPNTLSQLKMQVASKKLKIFEFANKLFGGNNE